MQDAPLIIVITAPGLAPAVAAAEQAPPPPPLPSATRAHVELDALPEALMRRIRLLEADTASAHRQLADLRTLYPVDPGALEAAKAEKASQKRVTRRTPAQQLADLEERRVWLEQRQAEQARRAALFAKWERPQPSIDAPSDTSASPRPSKPTAASA